MDVTRLALAGIFLATVLTIGCTGADEPTLKAAMFKSPATDGTKELAENFENKTGVDVVLDTYPYTSLREKIVSNFVAGNSEYDIVMMDIIWLPEFASKGWIEPLHPYMKNEKLYDRETYNFSDIIPLTRDALGRYPANGTLYGLPFMTNTHVLAYRTDLYRKHAKPAGIPEPGKTPETAWTWEEYVEAAKLMTRDTNDDGSTDIWGSTLQAKKGNSLVYEWFAYLFSFGGQDFSENHTPRFNTSEAVRAIEFYSDLFREHNVTPPSVLSWAHAEETAALSDGLAAMDATWNMELAHTLVDPNSSQHHDDIGFAMMPRHQNRSPTPDMGGYSLAVASDSDQKETAFKFLTWVTSPDVHKEIVLRGGTPFRYSEMNDPEILAEYPYYEMYDEALETSIYRTRIPEWPKISNVLAREISQAMLGEQSPNATGQEINTEIATVMDRAGYYESK